MLGALAIVVGWLVFYGLFLAAALYGTRGL